MKKRRDSLKYLMLLMLLFSRTIGFGQVYSDEDVSWNEPRVQDSVYYAKREKIVEPPYGLKKIKSLIAKREKSLPDGLLDEYDGGISQQEYNKMTVKEKFTYTMLYPEIFSQACAEFMYYNDPQTKIFAHLPLTIGSDYWSSRQITFIERNKKQIIGLIKECVTTIGFGANLKNAIVQMDGWEMIPFLLEYYDKHPEDKDIMTILASMLNRSKFEPFQKSKISAKLYGEDSSYFDCVNASLANENFIKDMAKQYFTKRDKS